MSDFHAVSRAAALNGSRELNRVEVMGRVGSGNLKLRDAAAILELSYRQSATSQRRIRDLPLTNPTNIRERTKRSYSHLHLAIIRVISSCCS
jgi:hypothetical protein